MRDLLDGGIRLAELIGILTLLDEAIRFAKGRAKRFNGEAQRRAG